MDFADNRLSLAGGQSVADRPATQPGLDLAIPHIVWIYWGQGEDQAPHLVRHCIASWRRMNPGWDVRVLDATTVSQYADVSDVPAFLPPQYKADLLRLRLLATYGGVWTDATTLCHRPLDEWMPLLGDQTGFFVFGGPYLDRWIDNWFIAANPKNELIQIWCAAYAQYATRLRWTPAKYFMMIYTLQWQLLRNRRLRRTFQDSGRLPAPPSYLLQAWFEKNADLSPLQQALRAGLPVSKMNWRLPMDNDEIDRRLTAALDVGYPALGISA